MLFPPTWFARIVAVALLLLPVAAQADSVPAEALERDYQNCMGGETAAKDPQRAQYCTCIKETMMTWDETTYVKFAVEQLQAGNKPSASMEALAKGCIDKVLKP